MKNQFKYFLEDITEVDDKMKNKLTILNSPIDILNKKEIEDLNKVMKIYKEKYEHFLKSLTSEIPKELKHILDSFTNKYINYTQQVEKINKKFENTSEEIKISYKNSRYEESVSELSDITDDKLEIHQIFLNSVVTINDIEKLKFSKTLLEEKRYIAQMMNLKNDQSKDQIIIDFYLNLFQFGLKYKFSNEKISTLMSILYFLFNYSIMNKKLSKEKSFNLFVDIMEFHSLNRPPYCYEIFSVEDKQLIIEYIKNSFYRNFMIFENIFKYNINICLLTRVYNPFESVFHSEMKSLQLNAKTDVKSFPLIHKSYIEKEEQKEKEVVEMKVKKTDVEIYEEMQLEKLKTFMKTFHKTKNPQDDKNNMMETMKQEMILQGEVNETKQFLETKIPEIIKDTTDKIAIKNKEIFKKLPHIETNTAKK